MNFKNAHAAILYSQTANQDVYEGQSFVQDWYLDTEGKSLNIFDLKINFDKDILAVTDATAGNSLISLWVLNPKVDNNAGTISLTGGIPNGVSGAHIPIFRSTFAAKKSGTASIGMDASSKVLINDGKGTPDILKFKPEIFNVYPKSFVPVQINSPDHPDQNAWYQNRDIRVKFSPVAATDYSWSFSSNIDIVPDDQSHLVPALFYYQNMPDGIYYFKLNSRLRQGYGGQAKVGNDNWTEAGVFRVQIDGTSPEAFSPLIGSEKSVYGGTSFVSFSTVDKTSGISHYKIKVGLLSKTKETQSPYKLHKPLIGDDVKILAFDRAGNSITESVAWRGYLSVDQFKWLLIMLGGTAVMWWLSKNTKPKDENQPQ